MNMHKTPGLWMRIAVASLLLAPTTSAIANDQDLPVLTAGYIQFPPIAYTDEQGHARGSIIELTNELAAASGYRVDWKSYPINRIYRSLDTGDIDLWPGSPQVPALQDFTVESSSLRLGL